MGVAFFLVLSGMTADMSVFQRMIFTVVHCVSHEEISKQYSVVIGAGVKSAGLKKTITGRGSSENRLAAQDTAPETILI